LKELLSNFTIGQIIGVLKEFQQLLATPNVDVGAAVLRSFCSFFHLRSQHAICCPSLLDLYKEHKDQYDAKVREHVQQVCIHVAHRSSSVSFNMQN
jgi:hypothetical protein